MEIDWTIVTYFFIGYFAVNGLFKGWWIEALTTILLAILIFFLQKPDWAQGVIVLFNDLLTTVWSAIPSTITSAVSDQVFQADATGPGTWLTILAVVVGGAILLGRLTFGHQPTGFGKALGGLVGGLNGFLVLNIIREYLDGRALPGQTPPASALRLVGSSSFGPAASDISIRVTGLPNFTILDSIIPWLTVGLGLLFFFSVFRTRFGIASNKDGRKLVAQVPPFYKKPAKP
jgi:hypothetical protein